MTNEQLQTVYTAVFTIMIEHWTVFSRFPTDVETLCFELGIELCPLSTITESTGLTDIEVFEIWGNEDGVLMQYNGTPKIAYNDLKPRQRIRFTIAEEITHYILGHADDPRFNIFSQQYDSGTYSLYEESGRAGAGIILCQPQYFFQHPEHFNTLALSSLCDVSWGCAEVRCDVFRRFRFSITSNPLYGKLPHPWVSQAQIARIIRFAI